MSKASEYADEFCTEQWGLFKTDAARDRAYRKITQLVERALTDQAKALREVPVYSVDEITPGHTTVVKVRDLAKTSFLRDQDDE